MAPSLVKHEKIATAFCIDFCVAMWAAVRDRVPTADRERLDAQCTELRRMITATNPNTKPAPLNPPPSAPKDPQP